MLQPPIKRSVLSDPSQRDTPQRPSKQFSRSAPSKGTRPAEGLRPWRAQADGKSSVQLQVFASSGLRLALQATFPQHPCPQGTHGHAATRQRPRTARECISPLAARPGSVSPSERRRPPRRGA
jgi:hypothetical protein